MWIDAVGGFRICLGNRARLGQAVPGSEAEVPIFADIGRHHATLVRDEEGYVLEAVRKVQVNGRPVEKVVLHDGDRVTLGTSCQVKFSLPVSLSASARLDLVSGHRFGQGVDAVFLLADSLVLGPDPPVHVLVADMDEPVLLYRCQDGLGIHRPGGFLVEGRPCKERGRLEAGAVVAGTGFSLALEALSESERRGISAT